MKIEELMKMPMEEFKKSFVIKKWFVEKNNTERFNYFSWEELDAYLNSSD